MSFLSSPVVSPGGSNSQIQFNKAGAFGGDPRFAYNSVTNTLTIPPTVNSLGSIILSAAANPVGVGYPFLNSAGAGTVLGGNFDFTTGAASAGVSGSSTITTGAGTTGTGDINLTCGIATGNGSFAGNINLTCGASSGVTGNGGSFSVQLGTGATTNGAFNLYTALGTPIAVIGGATALLDKIGFYGVVPVVRPTVLGTGSAAVVVNSSLNFVYQGTTFGGYTLAQIAQALVNLGLLT